jgi:hypothetical protein
MPAWKLRDVLSVTCLRLLFLQCVEVLSMAAQVGNFTNLARKWKRENRRATDLISKSLFFISVGSNDLFEYSDSLPAPGRNDTQFLLDLVANYTAYVKAISKLACIVSLSNPWRAPSCIDETKCPF